MKRYTTLTRCALLTAAALIISLLEQAIPIPVPGVKLGLANAVSLYLLLYHKPNEAFLVLLARLFLAALIAGNPITLLYSAAGGLLALGLTRLIQPLGIFSPIGLSIAGAAAHHIGQMACAVVLTRSPAILTYLPLLLLCSLLTGTLTGAVCIGVYRKINKNS